jgi:hypothetical protein
LISHGAVISIVAVVRRSNAHPIVAAFLANAEFVVRATGWGSPKETTRVLMEGTLKGVVPFRGAFAVGLVITTLLAKSLKGAKAEVGSGGTVLRFHVCVG